MSRTTARLHGVTKRFGAEAALDGAGLELLAGEVHGVLGENGAGKTTLLNVLGGMLRPDAGSVEIGGHTVALSSPRDAWSHGVAMVHQHFTLVPRMSVLENLALGMGSAGRRLRLSYDDVRRSAATLAEETGLTVPLEAAVESLGVGDRQRVEILKTLLREPELLILDEPTAALAPAEVETLFRLLRELAGAGRTVVLVAHRLDEVLAVADRLTVLRRGRTVLAAPRDEVDTQSLVRAMVGKGEVDPVALGASQPDMSAGRGGAVEADVVAVLDAVRVRGPLGRWAVDGASLSVRRGEIVGVAGVEGNGQRELARVLAGRLAPEEGHAVLPRAIGFIPQDRSTEGIIGDFDLTENVALAVIRERDAEARWTVRWADVRAHTRALLAEYDVRAPGPEARARTLSGGNQQRLVAAREMASAADLLVAENPTRGLDVSAAAFVHRRLAAMPEREPAAGVVLLSTDLDEVLALSHRLFVMVRGRLLPVRASERSRSAVGALMLAGDDAAA